MEEKGEIIRMRTRDNIMCDVWVHKETISVPFFIFILKAIL